MKNLKISAISLAFVLLFVFKCNREDKETHEKGRKATLGKSAGNCSCIAGIPSNCEDCISKDLMHGKQEAIYTVYWDNCTPDNSCDGNTSTSVKFCFADPFDCKKIRMQIDNPPSCLPCIPNPFCIEGDAVCSGSNGNAFSYVYTDVNTGISYSVTFTGDPKIKVCCTQKEPDPQNSGQMIDVQYCCLGNALFTN